MNTQQRNYALNRISTMASSARAKLTEEHTVKATNVTWAVAAELYVSGGLKLNLDKLGKMVGKGSAYPYDVFFVEDLPGYVSNQHITDEGVKALSEFDAKVTAIKDDLMLGDSAQALKAIADFEATFG